MKPLKTASTAAALLMSSAMLASQTQGRGNAAQDRPPFEIFRVEGQPIDRRPPELDTDHPVFPGQTHAPYRKTVDVSVTTIASNLDVPWAVALLPSGRFLITEKPGRFRILNRDGSSFQTITENLPSIHVRGQAGSSMWRWIGTYPDEPQNLLHLRAQRRRGHCRAGGGKRSAR